MMFLVSKTVGFLIDPYNLIVLAGLSFLLPDRQWVGRWLKRLSLVYFAMLASLFLVPWGGWLVAPLERWPLTSDLGEGERVAGTIVLGGAANGRVSRVRQSLELSEHGDRVLELLTALSTGDGPVIYTGAFEAEFAHARLAPLLTAEQQARLLIEPDARTTAEHPWRLAAAGIELDRQATYQLVTSAFHLPRATAVFRQAGVRVHPVAVDYLSPGRTRPGWNPRIRHQLELLRIGIKEWVGLLGYRLAGRT